MTTKEVLQGARDYITPRNKWTVGTRKSLTGACCALGAIEEVAGSSISDCMKAVESLASLVNIDKCPEDPYNSYQPRDLFKVARYNNTHSHECVLEWFDRAIEAAA